MYVSQDIQGSWFYGIGLILTVTDVRWNHISSDTKAIKNITEKSKSSNKEYWKMTMEIFNSKNVYV